MNWNKDIRFPEKKSDEDWKEAVLPRSSEAERIQPARPAAASPPASEPKRAASRPEPKSSKPFLQLISSLGFQALYHLGEVPDPSGRSGEINLEAAQEVITLLMALQEKTAQNLSREESELVTSLLAEIQLKFAARS